jgi:hypothetical protein
MNDKIDVYIDVPLFDSAGQPLIDKDVVDVFEASQNWKPQTHIINVILNTYEMYITGYYMARISMMNNLNTAQHLSFLLSPIEQTESIIAYLMTTGAYMEWKK